MLLRTALLLALVAVPSARAQGTTTIIDNADCVMADSNGVNHFFMNGESFGTLTASYPCGSTSEFPCYCDTSQPNNIRCPYCMFPSTGNTVVCAQNGGDVTFTNPFGSQQTCDCQWLTGTNFTSNCTSGSGMEPAPTPQCTLQQNIDQCASMTAGVDFGSSCECATFCLGGFAGCCASGAACTVDCPGGSGDIVGGCPITSQGADGRDTSAPTPTPSSIPSGLPQGIVTPAPSNLAMDTVSALPSDAPSGMPSNTPSVFQDDIESTPPSASSEVESDEAKAFAPAGPSLILLSCLCLQLALFLL